MRSGLTSARSSLTNRRRQIFDYPYSLEVAGSTNNISAASFDATGSSGLYLTAWCWMKSAATNYLVGSVYGRYLFGKFDYGGLVNGRSWLLYVYTSGQLAVLLSSDGISPTKLYYTNKTIIDGNFHLCAFTWDNGTLKIYVDGEEATVSKAYDTAMTTIYNPTVRVALGHGYLNSAIVSRFIGNIGKAGTSPVVATAEQMRDLYYEGNVTLSSTSSLYEMEDGSGAVLTDTSGNGRNMSITTATWSMTTPRKQRPALREADKSILCPYGTVARATVTDAVAIQNIFAGGGGVSFWMYLNSQIGSVKYIEKSSVALNGWDIRWVGNLRLRHYFSGTAGDFRIASPATIIKAGSWIFVCVWYDNSNTANLPTSWIGSFFEPLFKPAASAATTPTGTASSDVGNNLLFGNNYAFTGPAEGYITEVRLYNKNTVFTDIEVNDLYYNNKIASTMGLIETWQKSDGGILFESDSGTMDATLTTATIETVTPTMARTVEG